MLSDQRNTTPPPSVPITLSAGGPFSDFIINSKMKKIGPGFTWCVNIVRQGANVSALSVTGALLKNGKSNNIPPLGFSGWN